MIGKPRIYEYVGPKALFDPNYVPPKLLHRKKEEKSLFSILNDSLSDKYCLNILYQGISGIGKKAIINKVLNDLSIKNGEEANFHPIFLNCNEKNLEELLILFLAELNKYNTPHYNLNSFLSQNISKLWSSIKLVRKKINRKLVFVLNNTETLKPGIYKKFLQFGRESKVTLISTVNKVMRASTLDLLNEFDLKTRLKFFSFKELLDILKQRIKLTFSHQIDNELLEFITDLIFEHYVPVPGKGIDILRELYPILNENKSMVQYEILEVCKNQFDTFQISDEFSMLSYISEEDLLTIIFLDNLSNYFINNSNFYIMISELKEIYDISCESLEYEKNYIEFNKIVKILERIGILGISKKEYNENDKKLRIDNENFNTYFLVINPHQLKAMVDAIFSKI